MHAKQSMDRSLALQRSLSREVRIAIVCAIAAAFAVGAVVLPPMAQSLEYHEFADARAAFGIANFSDVVTNLPFVFIGAFGLAMLFRKGSGVAFRDAGERWIYATFFFGIATTSAGSAFYHLAPDNARLVWDRLPMTIGFMSLLAAATAERIDLKAGVRLLVPLVLLGLASVAYWRLSAAVGTENLRPYMAVQYGSIALILAMAVLFPSAYTRANDIYVVAALYGLAKAAEYFDRGIFRATSEISGHSLKHLIAAFAVYQILRMLQMRARVG